MFEIVAEQVAHHALRIGHDPLDARVPVHARVKKVLDGAIRLQHCRRERPHRGGGMTHVLR